MINNIKHKSGFTLVELMITLLVISILLLIIFPAIHRARLAASHTIVRTNLKTIGTALEAYLSVNSKYPEDVALLVEAKPPYLNKDYFSESYKGYNYIADISAGSYEVIAEPLDKKGGRKSFKLTTGGNIEEFIGKGKAKGKSHSKGR